ncbi:UDP-N-acetylglucosamine 2-epimerase (non-hydrolyzing) [soil metagenome]
MSGRATSLVSRQSLKPLAVSVRRVRRPSKKLLTVFGTRPEVIKLAPVIRQLEAYEETLQVINVTSAQHTDLLYPLVGLFGLRIDKDLQVMQAGQTSNLICSRVLALLDPILDREKPDLILVQGDTTTTLAGALAGFYRGIPVAHVEAGLRSGNPLSPYPEEMNRSLITRLATYHFAATPGNRQTLLGEGVKPASVFVTGNPVIDSLKSVLERCAPTPAVEKLLHATDQFKRILLTTHRRESFGLVMTQNLRTLRDFVETSRDIALIFPVHPNPSVVDQARNILSGHPRIHLIEPLDYVDFIMLLKRVWLIVSDSGGVQEEVPTLGKPLLILRDNTERPEVLDSGVARLVGSQTARLKSMLSEAYKVGSWANKVKSVENPFGRGDSGAQIAAIIAQLLNVRRRHEERKVS